MKSRIRTALSLIVISTLITLALGGAAPASLASTVWSNMIVQGVSTNQAAAAVSANDGQVTARIDIINAVVAKVPSANIARLNNTAGVVRATIDQEVQAAGAAAAANFSAVVGADQVWATGDLGQGVTVASLDSGIESSLNNLRQDASHQDRILAYYDVFTGQVYDQADVLQSPRDPSGHGSHVFGIIANSDADSRGIAPDVKLVAVRVLDQNGQGTYANVLQGLNWVVQHKDQYNIRVLNISMYATPVAPYWADPYNLAVMAAWRAGIVVVTSAGNDGPAPLSIGVPGNTPYVITVGAFTDNFTPADFSDDYLPPFSASGPTLDAFVKPDVIAPGAHVVSLMKQSTVLANQYPDNKVGGNYFKMSGTSMSAGVVSGIVALMLSRHPELTPDQVKYRLTMTARPQFSEKTGLAAYSIWQQGAGRVWAPEAVSTSLQGTANQGMDITADLAGTAHYQGWSVFDPVSGQFRIQGDGYNSWAGGYNSWAGGYNSWAGGYNSWAGGSTNWSGGFNSWAGGYNSWAGGYNSWAGGYNSWAGGYNSWAGGYNSWAGGYSSWAGGYSSWAGGYNSWAGFNSWAGYNSWAGNAGDPSWAAAFANLQNIPNGASTMSIDVLP